jgi:nucleoside recognition membrane protein YjiH
LWPTTSIPDTCLNGVQPDPESEEQLTPKQRLDRAWAEARRRAAHAPGPGRVTLYGFLDGLALAATLLGTILTVGTCAILLSEHTNIFAWLGRPLEPVIDLFGLPDAAKLAPASIAGITEMYIPALLSRQAAVQGRFFICVLSISQLIFFSSVGPMMMDMFRDIPIRFHHLAAIFFIRTAFLIPLLALATHVLSALGVFDGL